VERSRDWHMRSRDFVTPALVRRALTAPAPTAARPVEAVGA
jgi:hypothetical protein